ncbi:MAG: hypothetical protein ABH837_00920 [bacterium]
MKRKFSIFKLFRMLGIILGIIILAAIACGVLYLMFILQIWNLPMGLIGLCKNEPAIGRSFVVILGLLLIAAFLIHRKTSRSF